MLVLWEQMSGLIGLGGHGNAEDIGDEKTEGCGSAEETSERTHVLRFRFHRGYRRASHRGSFSTVQTVVSIVGSRRLEGTRARTTEGTMTPPTIRKTLIAQMARYGFTPKMCKDKT